VIIPADFADDPVFLSNHGYRDWLNPAGLLFGGVYEMLSEQTYMIRALVRHPEICADFTFEKCPACNAQHIIWDKRKQHCFKCGFNLQRYIKQRKLH
jgi:hypothetical protein